jgi:hypothetical protein
MSTKRNKRRYQSKPVEMPELTLTGRAFLQYADDAASDAARAGDVLLYPSVEALRTLRQGEYGITGYSGYFKCDVFDGKRWKPLLPQGIFARKEQYFSKSERPADTCMVCRESIAACAGRTVRRTYREHYALINEE